MTSSFRKRKKIIVLGATGSIGTSAVDIIRHHPDLFELAGISAYQSKDKLDALGSEFPEAEKVLVIENGENKLLEMIRETEADLVLNGISGANGMFPSKAALESGKNLALANKETMVMAGALILELARKMNVSVIPVDSEHSAVFHLISSFGKNHLDEIILTASGGPFRTWDRKKIAQAAPEDALKHPTWTMGTKITIDSASLANKGLEVIEACKLFSLTPDRVRVVVHPQSLVHSFIRTSDKVLYAQISHPDMRHPILSAFSWPEIIPNFLEPFSFEDAIVMQFEPVRYDDFPMLNLAYRSASLDASYPIAYNAANEVAVASFVNHAITFPQIAEITAKVLDNDWSNVPGSFEEIGETDSRAREKTIQAVKEVNI
ncbi:1-deoxy-D-xylulose-5-phosphate reductoisomerase [Brucepastera parasyntrophica]|uniref:1-deoxy-D-xylulose-5-phosphate reductoisomerase n=1 Tax=Brucepastera parasyntrophica TaxID=2880008 RepID=UPI00210B4438|nr:1-deoxy-D-xylulose-5-phosphate reductoisomerase [Brucepastera parasyntrophica]ULQ59962.1 1-deoxy-D-xylulose-5-phosphate reductoisomerase [Brucepastera parasyntrophica]